jgi:hypothetical protein
MSGFSAAVRRSASVSVGASIARVLTWTVLVLLSMLGSALRR